MADDMTHRGPQDRSQINLSEDYEVQYCTDKLELSKAQLEDALREVGASADAVETASLVDACQWTEAVSATIEIRRDGIEWIIDDGSTRIRITKPGVGIIEHFVDQWDHESRSRPDARPVSPEQPRRPEGAS